LFLAASLLASYNRQASRPVVPEAIMPSRIALVFLSLLFLFAPQVIAKNKKKQLLPDYVLKAQSVLVVIHPDAGEALTSPMANRTAQDEVERAITKWGRFQLATDARDAELIIAVRKGTKNGPVIMHSPADNRPVILQPGNNGDVRAGQQTGRPPDLTMPTPGDMDNRGPQLGNQIGSSDDTFEVYMGGGEYPLDSPPLWRYIAKDSLNAPQVQAVEQFRKAIEESEKQRHKP
jgi:hypothetical protein